MSMQAYFDGPTDQPYDRTLGARMLQKIPLKVSLLPLAAPTVDAGRFRQNESLRGGSRNQP